MRGSGEGVREGSGGQGSGGVRRLGVRRGQGSGRVRRGQTGRSQGRVREGSGRRTVNLLQLKILYFCFVDVFLSMLFKSFFQNHFSFFL